jgi:hypothetical protein
MKYKHFVFHIIEKTTTENYNTVVLAVVKSGGYTRILSNTVIVEATET